MIEQRAIITRIENDYAWIEAQRETSCGTCSAQKGCGTGLLAKTIGRRFVSMRVHNPICAQVGDNVIIGLPEDSFLKTAFLTYFLPLLLMLLGAMLFATLTSNQLFVVLGGLAGFLLGWLILRRHVRRLADNPANQPVVIRKIQPNIPLKNLTKSVIDTTF